MLTENAIASVSDCNQLKQTGISEYAAKTTTKLKKKTELIQFQLKENILHWLPTVHHIQYDIAV